MIHTLKIDSEYFEDIKMQRKNFEVRKNDRDFRLGDFIILNEFKDDLHTGSSIIVCINYILYDKQYVKDGYCILGIQPCTIHCDYLQSKPQVYIY